MRIGVLTETVSYHSGARAPLEISKYLAKSGNQVTVYGYGSIKDPKAAADLRKNDVRVKIIPVNKKPIVGKFFASASLYKMLKKDLPQVLTFSATPPFFFAGKFSNIPIVRMYQGTQFDAYLEKFTPEEKPKFIHHLINKAANIYIYLIDFISFRLSSSVVAISDFSAKEGEFLYKRKVETYIFHGSTNIKDKSSKKSVKNKIIQLISVSRLTPYKGFHLIIEAIKKLKVDFPIAFTIIGSQPKENYLKYLRKIGGKNLMIIVDPSDEQLANYYKDSDIYVSADKYLYFGLPIYEAALNKIPAISFKLAAACEIIEHNKSGFIAKNTDDFARYLKIMIEDGSLRKKLGLNAYKKAKKYSWKFCAENWEKVLTKFAVKE